MKRAKTVDDYIAGADLWRKELVRLRHIINSTGLVETIKWGGPCYTHRGKNVVSMGAFKSYFGLWFHQGALLDDDAGVLINAQQGKTRALRQWRMQAAKDIKPALIRRFVRQAIDHVESGNEIKARRSKPLVMPDELAKALRRKKGSLASFRDLKPGQQREYADYVREAKQETTKTRRIDRILPMILAGMGLNDRYR